MIVKPESTVIVNFLRAVETGVQGPNRSFYADPALYAVVRKSGIRAISPPYI